MGSHEDTINLLFGREVEHNVPHWRNVRCGKNDIANLPTRSSRPETQKSFEWVCWSKELLRIDLNKRYFSLISCCELSTKNLSVTQLFSCGTKWGKKTTKIWIPPSSTIWSAQSCTRILRLPFRPWRDTSKLKRTFSLLLVVFAIRWLHLTWKRRKHRAHHVPAGRWVFLATHARGVGWQARWTMLNSPEGHLTTSKTVETNHLAS